MRTTLATLLVAFAIVGAGPASAKGTAQGHGTPDGEPPSVETVCDNETGAAFGLCNSYCEAMDCDSPNHHSSDAACAAVKKNFEKKTGRPLPCEVTCPCGGILQPFADVTSGTATILDCFETRSVVSIITSPTDFVVVDAGPPTTCSANLQAPFVDLTATEQLVCRVQLEQAAAAQGIACHVPE